MDSLRQVRPPSAHDFQSSTLQQYKSQLKPQATCSRTAVAVNFVRLLRIWADSPVSQDPCLHRIQLRVSVHVERSSCFYRDGTQSESGITEQAAQRRLLASELAARTSKIKTTIESISTRLHSPQPGSDFVQSIAAALDAGETQITDLKAEQRQNYDALTQEVYCSAGYEILHAILQLTVNSLPS